MDKKILKFDLSPKDIQIKKILNKEFLEMEIYAISDIYPNRNDSHFTLDSMENSKGSFYNKPILGYFNNFSNDFEEHNGKQAFDRELEEKYWDCNGIRDERILGLIRESDNIEIVQIDDVNWIKVTCAIWAQYSYRQVKRLLKSKSKKVSVEVEVPKWHYDENKILIIDEFNVTGITILGDKISEGIPGAHLNVLEIIQSQNYSEKVQCLTFAYKKSDSKKSEEDFDKKEEARPKEEGIEDDESNTIKFDLNDEELTKEETEEDDSHLDKNFKGLEEYKLTYQEKRNLLDTAIRKFDPEYKELYVVDFSDEFVIINSYCENKYYKISYTMEIEDDGEKDTAKFSFDFENKQEVESSWKPATGIDVESKRFVTVEDQELDIDQLLQKYIELKEGCGCENSDETDGNIEEKEEDGGAEEENKKEEEKECNLAEETNEESEEENSEKECDMAEEETTEENFEEENSEKECDMTEEEKLSKDEENSEETKSEEECNRYAELQEKYNQLTQDYSSLNSQFAEVNAKYTDLFNQVEQAEREKIRDFGISMAESEDELDKDDKNNIIEKCKKFEYSSTEEIEDDIAKMLYQKKKNNRQTKFKSNVVISQKISDKNDVWDRWGNN